MHMEKMNRKYTARPGPRLLKKSVHLALKCAMLAWFHRQAETCSLHIKQVKTHTLIFETGITFWHKSETLSAGPFGLSHPCHTLGGNLVSKVKGMRANVGQLFHWCKMLSPNTASDLIAINVMRNFLLVNVL